MFVSGLAKPFEVFFTGLAGVKAGLARAKAGSAEPLFLLKWPRQSYQSASLKTRHSLKQIDIKGHATRFYHEGIYGVIFVEIAR